MKPLRTSWFPTLPLTLSISPQSHFLTARKFIKRARCPPYLRREFVLLHQVEHLRSQGIDKAPRVFRNVN